MTARGVLAAGLSWAQAGPDASATVPATSRARTTRSLRRRDKVLAIIAAAAAAAASPHGDADARDHRQDQEDHEQAGDGHQHHLDRKRRPAAGPASALSVPAVSRAGSRAATRS